MLIVMYIMLDEDLNYTLYDADATNKCNISECSKDIEEQYYNTILLVLEQWNEKGIKRSFEN